mgnify:CR=1 FL=1
MITWGIIGLGAMANRFAIAMSEIENSTLLGIASTSIDKLTNFGDQYNIKNNFRFNTYDEILNCNEINSIYISTLNNTHADIVAIQTVAKVALLHQRFLQRHGYGAFTAANASSKCDTQHGVPGSPQAIGTTLSGHPRTAVLLSLPM